MEPPYIRQPATLQLLMRSSLLLLPATAAGAKPPLLSHSLSLPDVALCVFVCGRISSPATLTQKSPEQTRQKVWDLPFVWRSCGSF